PGLIPQYGTGYPRVTHPFATPPPSQRPGFSVRLACVKHAASVRPEPGSNSPTMNPDKTTNTQTNACRPQTQRNPNRVPKNQLAKLTNTLLSSQTTRRTNPCGLEASGFAPCWGREPCPRRCFPVRFGPARSDVRELYTSSRPPKTGGSLKI